MGHRCLGCRIERGEEPIRGRDVFDSDPSFNSACKCGQTLSYKAMVLQETVDTIAFSPSYSPFMAPNDEQSLREVG